MTTDQSIFGENKPATQPNENGGNTNAQNSNDLANLLGSIKNERGEPKYKSVEDALVGLRNAQEYIPQLTAKLSTQEQELKDAREAAARVAELQRTVEALTSGNNSGTTQPNAGITQDQIVELVSQTLTKKQQEDAAKANVTAVVKTLQEQFGADAEKTYNAKAEEFGMSVAEMNVLASRNPKAVYKILGINAEAPKPTLSSAPSVNFNTDGFQRQQDSFIGRNTKPTLIGATTADLQEETQRAKSMVDELHKQGKSISDLTNPKVYFKVFK